MDKRTIFFVLSLSLTLLAVNMFFEQKNQDNLREWHQQESAKKTQKIVDLKEEIRSKTAKIQDLPLVELLGDQGGYLTSGVKIQNSILTTTWTKDLPQTIQSNGETFQLAFSTLDGPALYEKTKSDILNVGDLPYFGHFPLQLVSFTPGIKTPQVHLGNYSDGTFSIPSLKVQELQKDLGEEVSKVELPRNSIVLMSTPDGYLPVAIYQSKNQNLLQLEQIEGLVSELKQPLLPDSQQDQTEQFYVLENDYQQLVFSSKGAALIEINLPFETEKNQKSVVKEIEFDKEIEDDHPYNARFPTQPYKTAGNIDHSKGKLGGYYPLLRRDLIQSSNKASIRVLPEYYALNIVSQYPEMAELNFRVTHFDEHKIVFEAVQSNRKIVKTYSFDKEKNAPYVVNLSIHIEGDARGLWLTSGVPDVEWISNAPAPALKYRITRNGKVEVNSMDKPKELMTMNTIQPDWICNSNGFFGMIVDPLTPIDDGLRTQYVSGTTVPSRLVQIGEEFEKHKAKDLPGYMMMLPLNSKGGTMNFRIFAGPFDSKTLDTVDKIYTDQTTGYNPDYVGSQTFHGWFSFISAPFSKFLFVLMRLFHTMTGSWGLSIILLTVALKVMLYPLNAWSSKSMLKMQQISPKVQDIQAKYKNDPKRAQLEVMNLYRESGVNPVSGCFPMLIQLPFLIGMFDLLKSTFELRGASFIPGWIDNLAAPDVLFSWHTPIFFIGNQLHLLPILLGAVMFLQQKVMATGPTDPNLMTEQQRQQRAMGTMMTVVFSVMFYHFPSGLNLYWLSSMLLGIVQQKWTQKQMKAQPVVVETVTPKKGGKGRKRR